LEESLSSKTSVIVAYHPPIFKGLTALTLSNPLQRSLLRCVENGISIYSPHTSLDSVWGGVNDWLADVVLGETGTSRKHTTALVGEKISPDGAVEGAEGRLVTLPQPVTMEILQSRIKSGLKLQNIQVGYGTSNGERSSASSSISTVAICAGSGGSMLAGKNADVYFTGEMSHHEVLAACASGHHVILCGHDNTERGYLPTLATLMQEELKVSSVNEKEQLKVVVSNSDRHPLDIV
jgi:dinuclear metal center YbgI/SA1388 family protein